MKNNWKFNKFILVLINQLFTESVQRMKKYNNWKLKDYM